MTERTSQPPSFSLGLFFGFVVGLATGLLLDPSCNPAESSALPTDHEQAPPRSAS